MAEEAERIGAESTAWKASGDRLRDIVEDGMRRGRFRRLHAALVAEVFQAAVGRLNEPDFLETAGISFSDGFSELYELFLNGLFSQPSPP